MTFFTLLEKSILVCHRVFQGKNLGLEVKVGDFNVDSGDVITDLIGLF